MPDAAKQKFPSGGSKIVTISDTERCADCRNKQKQHRSQEVLAFPRQEIPAIKHNVYYLFTKVTFLFTIQITPAEKYQSSFAESNSGKDMKNRIMPYAI
nr:hypothetical protein [uncultured Mucilaginibacter sp.]